MGSDDYDDSGDYAEEPQDEEMEDTSRWEDYGPDIHSPEEDSWYEDTEGVYPEVDSPADDLRPPDETLLDEDFNPLTM